MPTWTSATIQAICINMNSGGKLDHRHEYEPQTMDVYLASHRMDFRYQISIRPPAAADQITDICMTHHKYWSIAETPLIYLVVAQSKCYLAARQGIQGQVPLELQSTNTSTPSMQTSWAHGHDCCAFSLLRVPQAYTSLFLVGSSAMAASEAPCCG